MRSYADMMHQVESIITGLDIDGKVQSVEISEHYAALIDSRYRAAKVTLKNGDHITVREDGSFDATDSNWNGVPLLSVRE